MEYIYATLILHRLGKPITVEGITRILKAAGVNVDEARAKMLVESLANIDIDSVLKTPVQTQLSLTPSPSPSTVAPKEEKKAKEEEKREEEAVEGLSALFG